MLSKSQAKAFFLGGTVVCAAAFILLTIDTFQRIPNQTHEEKLSAAAIRGKHLFEKNNCMGCHTIFGEGAYYAPELTAVYSRRGPAFIQSMLKDPASMYPGQRKMVKYGFNDQEIADLVAFFQWVGEVDLNGFPPKPDLAAPQGPRSAAALVGRPAIFNQVCVACHTLGGQGGNIGPILDGVGSRRDASYINKWLHDPQSIKADAKMPKLSLSDGAIDELTAFLLQQKETSK